MPSATSCATLLESRSSSNLSRSESTVFPWPSHVVKRYRPNAPSSVVTMEPAARIVFRHFVVYRALSFFFFFFFFFVVVTMDPTVRFLFSVILLFFGPSLSPLLLLLNASIQRDPRSELKNCVEVEVAVLDSLSLIVRTVSVDVKQHSTNGPTVPVKE